METTNGYPGDIVSLRSPLHQQNSTSCLRLTVYQRRAQGLYMDVYTVPKNNTMLKTYLCGFYYEKVHGRF